MTSIGGSDGIGGPSGPVRPDGASQVAEPAGDPPVDAAEAPATDTGILADLAAGRLSPREAIDRLVEAAAGPGLDPAERAELRELFNDLIANDPHLGSLIGRI